MHPVLPCQIGPLSMDQLQHLHNEYPIPSIIDIVSSIRLAKGNVFAEWKNSDTAKLFEDHGYKNKKQAGGYFF